MHKEGYYQNIEIDILKLRKYLSQKICSDKALVLLLKADDMMIGFFVAEIIEYFFSRERLAMDSLFFIIKKKRKSIGAIKLLKVYFEWVKLHNVKEITLSSTNGVEVEKIEKLYVKLGFKRVGIMYKKGV